MKDNVRATRDRGLIMFDLWKLKYRRATVMKSFEPFLEEAYRQNKTAELDALLDQRSIEIEPVESRIQVLIGRRITNEAEKLDVDMPSYASDSDLWRTSEFSGTVYLSPKGRSYLRKLIDEEKARRFEVKVRWIKLLIPLIAALAGLIGVITGLISVSRR